MIGRKCDALQLPRSKKKNKFTCANEFWSFYINQVRKGLMDAKDLMAQALASLSGDFGSASGGGAGGGGYASIFEENYSGTDPPVTLVLQPQPQHVVPSLQKRGMISMTTRLRQNSLKNMFFAMTIAGISLFAACDKTKSPIDDPDNPIIPPITVSGDTVFLKSQADAVMAFDTATVLLQNPERNRIVIDGRELGTLQLGGADWTQLSAAIDKFTAETKKKSGQVMIPSLQISGDVRVPAQFHRLTRQRTSAKSGVEAPAEIIIDEDGNIHFVGTVLCGELVVVLNIIGRRGADDVFATADTIQINNNVRTYADGPEFGLPMEGIFKVVQAKNITASPKNDGSHGRAASATSSETRVRVTSPNSIIRNLR
jgi:hypothetical protein